MLVLRQPRNTRSGQAMVELLPSLILFFMVMSAGLAYFRVMRMAVMRQEAVRNIAFAKIANKGSLTTSRVEAENGISLSSDMGGGGVSVVPESRNDFVSYEQDCFTVTSASAIYKVSMSSIYSIGVPKDVDITSYATVYRRPSGTCPF
jgi:hypothetical protein